MVDRKGVGTSSSASFNTEEITPIIHIPLHVKRLASMIGTSVRVGIVRANECRRSKRAIP